MIKKAIFLYFFLISVANSSSLPLIGLDSKGNPKEVSLKKSEWDLKLKELDGIRTTKTIESMLKPQAK